MGRAACQIIASPESKPILSACLQYPAACRKAGEIVHSSRQDDLAGAQPQADPVPSGFAMLVRGPSCVIESMSDLPPGLQPLPECHELGLTS